MVLTQEKILFIHIPKTGSSSIENYLLDHFGYNRGFLTLTDGIYKGYDSKNTDLIPYPILHLPLYLTELMLNHSKIQIDDSWKIFSIIRNPYDKFISELFFVSYIPLKYHYHTLSNTGKIHLINRSIDLYLGNLNSINYHSNHSLPQYKFFENTNRECKIFKFEDGLVNSLKQLNLWYGGELPTIHNIFNTFDIPKPTSYKELYTQKLIKEVNTKYQQDFEIFNYEMLDPLAFP